MAVSDVTVFPGFLTLVLTQFCKVTDFFLTSISDKRLKILMYHLYQMIKFKVCPKRRLNRGSNSQPPGHESDILTTEPPGQGVRKGEIARNEQFLLYPQCFLPV